MVKSIARADQIGIVGDAVLAAFDAAAVTGIVARLEDTVGNFVRKWEGQEDGNSRIPGESVFENLQMAGSYWKGDRAGTDRNYHRVDVEKVRELNFEKVGRYGKIEEKTAFVAIGSSREVIVTKVKSVILGKQKRLKEAANVAVPKLIPRRSMSDQFAL